MQTDRGLDRLTFFTDAIAAIAITLLILPLVDLVPGTSTSTPPLGFLRDHLTEIGGFVLSFVVIARLWMTHHSLFEHVAAYSNGLRWLSLAWAFTIVLLPLPTAMVAHWRTEPVIVAFYVGTMFLSSCLLTGMTLLVSRNPSLQTPEAGVEHERVLSSILSSAEFLVALVIGTVFPAVNFFALLLLFVSTPLLAIIRNRRSKENTRA